VATDERTHRLHAAREEECPALRLGRGRIGGAGSVHVFDETHTAIVDNPRPKAHHGVTAIIANDSMMAIARRVATRVGAHDA
jgi:tRNA(Ile2) C34 agmatinyltransferase TiaS